MQDVELARMANYSSSSTRTNHNIQNSYGQRFKSPKFMGTTDTNVTDYSIFIGYGTKAKRIKDRWEAMKRLLLFENNFVALKWLLDNFVDEYLRSKHMEDTIMATAETSRRDRRLAENTNESEGRHVATRSPPRTRFEEVPSEQGHERGSLATKSSPVSSAESRPRSSLKDHKTRPASDGVRVSGDMHLTGQYPYKYVPEYWPSYYHWSGGVPVNPRLVNVSSIPRYSGYMVKTPSCSSLPTREGQKTGQHLKRWGSQTAVKEERESGLAKAEKRPAVNLGLKTKSLPNLQFIPKETEPGSEDEEDVQSDPESPRDLITLSSSSLSMPNLHKIPADRPPMLSPPPPGRRYEPLLRDRHKVCASSSLSMPNLQSIDGVPVDDRQKIRDFVMNRLTKTDGDPGSNKTKIFSPNGYYMSNRIHDSEKKLVKQDIRRRLLQRIEAKRQNEETHTEVCPRKKAEKATSPHLKVVNRLPRVSENSVWPAKGFGERTTHRDDARVLVKEDSANNNWKVPRGPSYPPRNVREITWDDAQAKKTSGSPGIWNPADVHVKKEGVSDETRNGSEFAPAVSPTESKMPQSSPHAIGARNEEESEKLKSGKQEDKRGSESSDEEEEHVDVESLKEADEAVDDSGCSDDELADDTCADGKRNKRRKPDHPRKRLKAI